MKGSRYWEIFIITAIFFLSSCTKNEEEPLSWKPENPDDGWCISSLSEQDLDSAAVRNLYTEARELDNLYGLLATKNGYLC